MTQITVGTLVQELEKALSIVDDRFKTQKLGISLKQATVELSVETKREAKIGGGFDFIIHVAAEAEHEWTRGQTLKFSLKPSKPLKLGSSESDEIADTIIALGMAMREASNRTGGGLS